MIHLSTPNLPKSLVPFRSLVRGPIKDLNELATCEKFVRNYVLHDEMGMEIEPWPDPGDERPFTKEEELAGGRNVIVAVGPVIEEYGLFDDFRNQLDQASSAIELTPELCQLAEEFANAGQGNVYFKAHVEYLQRLVAVLQDGGSVVCACGFANAALTKASEFPEELFDKLDASWKDFVTRAQRGEVGPIISPVLSIVLSRCARRDAIPNILRDLREEWSAARQKVWSLLDELKHATSLKAANEIQRELDSAAEFMTREIAPSNERPTRVLWKLTTGAISGAAIGTLSGGSWELGAASAAIVPLGRMLADEVSPAVLFRRGAFDLARRVGGEAASTELPHKVLAGLLTQAEIKNLGL